MIAARHVFLGELASGGFGRVFLARDEYLGREVAIKRLRHDRHSSKYFEREQLLHEAKVLAAVQHPNIVTIYDVNASDGVTEIVMEYVAGVTARQLVSRHLLNASDFVVFAKQMLFGLSAAHEHEVLHCDIKPSNVMVASVSENRMTVKLLDFGMSPSSGSSRQQLVGSALFMAPEIYEGKGHTKQSDLYSAGCLFYYMLAGVVPFDGRDTIEIMASHCGGDFHPLHSLRSDLPEDLCTWVELLMAARPDMRFRDCHEALEELTGIPVPSNDGERTITIAEGMDRVVHPITQISLKPDGLDVKTQSQGVSQVYQNEMLMTRKISEAVCNYAMKEHVRQPYYRRQQEEVLPPKRIEQEEVVKLRKNQWYVMLHGRKRGPLELDELGRLVLGGYITCDDLVWHEGWNDWRRADECPDTGVYLCEYRRMHYKPQPKVERKPMAFAPEDWELWVALGIGALSILFVYIRPQAWVFVLSLYASLLALEGYLSLKLSERKDGRKWLLTGLFLPVIGDVYYACHFKKRAIKGLLLMLLGGVYLGVAVSSGQWDWSMLNSIFPR